jgi:hypothetical protein
MDEVQEFQLELKNALLNADVKIDRKEMLVDIFKSYVAKLFEVVLSKQGGNRIPFDALVEVKSRLISSFRGAELGEYQKSEAQYDELFETTVKEILNECAANHRGEDLIQLAPEQFEINKNEFHRQASGLFVPVTAAV